MAKRCYCVVCKGMDYILEKYNDRDFLEEHEHIGAELEGEAIIAGKSPEDIHALVVRHNREDTIDEAYKKYKEEKCSKENKKKQLKQSEQ